MRRMPDFVKAYKDAYDEAPNQFAADAYDCVHAIAEAIDKAGLTFRPTVPSLPATLQSHAQDQD